MTSGQRHPFKVAASVAEMITDHITGGGHVCAVAGSVRRRAKTVGDIDLVVMANHLHGVELPTWLHIVRGGKDYRRYVASLTNGAEIGVDIWRCPSEEAWGGFMLFATGTAEYNVHMRRHAWARGLKLNQHGLWRAGQHIGLREEEITEALNLPYLTPSERQQWKPNKPTKRKETV
jgi:DNA polymerase (family 10)